MDYRKKNKILWILGGNLKFSNYFGINAFCGNLVDIINNLKLEIKKKDEIVIILDIQDEDEFPDENNKFWNFFNVHSHNRVLFVLHKRNKNIENVISNKKKSGLISGPLFYDYHLADKTPISYAETELILYSVYQIFPDLETDLNGVLSIRTFLPDNILKLPQKMNEVYQKTISQENGISLPEYTIIKEDLDITQFKINYLLYNPFDIDVDKELKIEVDERTIDNIIDENLNDNKMYEIVKILTSIRNQKLSNRITTISPELRIKGAKNLLIKLVDFKENIKHKIRELKRSLSQNFNFIEKIREEAKENLTEQFQKFSNSINDELDEYNKRFKNFFKFIFAYKTILNLFIILLIIIFFLIHFKVKLDLPSSILIALIISSTVILLKWIKKKSNKKKEIKDLCDEGYAKIINVLNQDYKKIPLSIWKRNLNYINLKITNISYEYVQRSLDSLKLITENSPQDLTDNIFSTKQKMIFFIPTANDFENIHLDDFNIYLNLDKSDLNDYFSQQYFKQFKSFRLGSLTQEIAVYFNDYYKHQEKGLLWDFNDVIDYRELSIQKKLFIPKNYFIPQGVDIEKNVVKEFPENQELNIIVLLSLFQFKKANQ